MRSLLIFLACAGLAAPAAGAGCKVPPAPRSKVVDPTLDVVVERVDPARFPLVDVYFRVQDVNGTTALRTLKFRDLTAVADGPSGGALAPRTLMPPGADPNPELAPAVVRPLATAFNIDRSGSVDPVLENIKDAVSSYVHTDMNTVPNQPANPDAMYAIALGGIPRNLETCLRTGAPAGATSPLGFVSDVPTLDRYLGDLIVPEYYRLGSPIYRAWDAALSEVAAHPYETPEAARCLVCITDGYNNVGPASPCKLLGEITGYRVPNFVMGFVRIGKEAVDAGSVNRPVLVQAARLSQGSYFEPQPPVPRGLGPPPAAGSQADRTDYVEHGLDVLVDIIQDAGDADAPRPDFTAAITGPAAKVLKAAPTTPDALVAALSGDDGPDYNDPATITWTDQELKDFQKAVNADRTLQARTFTKQDLSEFYDVEVARFLKKIHHSLKYIYRTTYRVNEAPPFDASPRDLALSVGYAAQRTFPAVANVPLAATGGASYRLPAVVPENQVSTISVSPPRPTTDVATTLAPTNPRGGPWDGDAALSLTVSLWMETRQPDPNGPTSVVKLATLKIEPDGAQDPQLVVPADTLGVLAAGTDGGPSEPELYLRALHVAAPTLAAGAASFTVQPAIPTCPKNPDQQRPPLDDTEPNRSRLLWYTVEPYLVRQYTLAIKQLGAKDKPPKPPPPNTVFVPPGTTENLPKGGTVVAGGPLDGQVVVKRRVPLPAAVIYVSDQTPPSLAAYLSSDETGTSLATLREDPVDAATPASRLYLIGSGFAGDPKGTADAPRIADDPATAGYVITQGVPVRVQIAARDNFDRNHRHDYVLNGGVPASCTFPADPASAPELRDFQPPYLAKQPEAALFADRPSSAGVSWRFEDANGHGEDALADSKVFRSPNVRVDDAGNITRDGDPVFLHVRGADASGNVADLKLPILVVPTGIKLDQLKFSAERR